MNRKKQFLGQNGAEKVPKQIAQYKVITYIYWVVWSEPKENLPPMVFLKFLNLQPPLLPSQ